MILRINDRFRNREVQFFNSFKLNLVYDSVGSTFSFDFAFNPDNPEHKEMACIGHYHICTLEENGELLLTGIILSQEFIDSASPNLVRISGYSLPGVIEDCEIPTEVYPLQSDGLNLRQIAEKFVAPFGLKIVIDPLAASAMEEPYVETTAKETQSIKSYLSELASQKNIIISHNERGRLVFTKAPIKQKSIFHFEKGKVPNTTMSLKFDGQRMHSRITVLRQEDEDEQIKSGKGTAYNPLVPFYFRPKVLTQSSTNDFDVDTAAANALAKELKGLSVTINTDRWMIDKKIIRPGKLISVTNPSIYLYKKTDFIIESVELVGDKEIKTASLKCVLPEVYTGQTPVSPFKGINTHG